MDGLTAWRNEAAHATGRLPEPTFRRVLGIRCVCQWSEGQVGSAEVDRLVRTSRIGAGTYWRIVPRRHCGHRDWGGPPLRSLSAAIEVRHDRPVPANQNRPRHNRPAPLSHRRSTNERNCPAVFPPLRRVRGHLPRNVASFISDRFVRKPLTTTYSFADAANDAILIANPTGRVRLAKGVNPATVSRGWVSISFSSLLLSWHDHVVGIRKKV